MPMNTNKMGRPHHGAWCVVPPALPPDTPIGYAPCRGSEVHDALLPCAVTIGVAIAQCSAVAPGTVSRPG